MNSSSHIMAEVALYFKLLCCFLITAAAFSDELEVVPEDSVARSVEEELYSALDEHRFAYYLEGALSIGGISHSFNDDAIEQFGYTFRTGCEQDGAYLCVGGGKHFGRFGTFIYGELGRISAGSLMDGHGPYIPPEILLSMTMLGSGIELRCYPVRARLGLGSYIGTAEVDNAYEDSTQVFPPGSWKTSIEDADGWHYSVGFLETIDENLSIGIEWVQHFIDLSLERNGTSTQPSNHTAVQSEVRIALTYQFFSDK